MTPRIFVYAVATLDSKGRELAFLAQGLREEGVDVVLVDISLKGPSQIIPDISREQIAAYHPAGRRAVFGSPGREAGMAAMGEALAHFLAEEQASGRLQGAVGLGGSEGTALIAPAFRNLPLGIPKLLISTLASGNTAPYVGVSDMALLFPVTDLAGLNFLSRRILRNAAAAIAGMARIAQIATPTGPAVGLTMFGVTTPCVDRIREGLENRGMEGVVFHAVGTGGTALERLAAAGAFRAVMDITTTEIADLLAGGIFPAGPDRFAAIAEHHLPAVVSLGALDMVNFGPRESVPHRYQNRNLYAHTPLVTLMRTHAEENIAAGKHLAEILNRGNGPLIVLLPEGGLSALDAPGQPFYDPQANAALFAALEKNFLAKPHRFIRRVTWHINDPQFARAALKALDEVMNGKT